MNSPTAAILGAAIAAFVAFVVALYNGSRQSKLESERWLRAREDEADREFRVAVADLTRKIAQGNHRIVWLAWKARNEPASLTDDDFRMYDEQMAELFPDIVGSRVIVAALNKQVHAEISHFVNDLYSLDARVARARNLFKATPEKGRETLIEIYDETVTADARLLEKVTSVVGMGRKDS